MRLLKINKLLVIGLVVIFVLNLVSLILNSLTFFNHFESTKQRVELEIQEKISSKSCGRFPVDSDIIYDNVLWQILEMPNGFMKLFNAYLDERGNKTVVRVNVHSHNLNITRDVIYCQFWFKDNKQPFVIRALNFTLLWSDG